MKWTRRIWFLALALLLAAAISKVWLFMRVREKERVGMEDEIIVWHPVGSDWKESLQRVSGVPTRVERGVAEFEARDMWRKLGTLAESHFESAVSLFREIGISVP